MTEERKQVAGHVLACGTQIMWGATFVSSKVLLEHFLPSEVLFVRVVLAFLALLIVYPHYLKLKNPKQELFFAGAGLFGIVLYFMLENTALTLTYASNVGIIVACAPFFVAVMVGLFFKNEKSGGFFYIGFVIAMAGVIMISMMTLTPQELAYRIEPPGEPANQLSPETQAFDFWDYVKNLVQ